MFCPCFGNGLLFGLTLVGKSFTPFFISDWSNLMRFPEIRRSASDKLRLINLPALFITTLSLIPTDSTCLVCWLRMSAMSVCRLLEMMARTVSSLLTSNVPSVPLIEATAVVDLNRNGSFPLFLTENAILPKSTCSSRSSSTLARHWPRISTSELASILITLPSSKRSKHDDTLPVRSFVPDDKLNPRSVFYQPAFTPPISTVPTTRSTTAIPSSPPLRSVCENTWTLEVTSNTLNNMARISLNATDFLV